MGAYLQCQVCSIKEIASPIQKKKKKTNCFQVKLSVHVMRNHGRNLWTCFHPESECGYGCVLSAYLLGLNNYHF